MVGIIHRAQSDHYIANVFFQVALSHDSVITRVHEAVIIFQKYFMSRRTPIEQLPSPNFGYVPCQRDETSMPQ
uniref:Uncharacterized protein n=1 Tax=Aegilops tauschii subsp. strangulata TaxID=200361 RepID=A0A453RVF7_AEGTS